VKTRMTLWVIPQGTASHDMVRQGVQKDENGHAKPGAGSAAKMRTVFAAMRGEATAKTGSE